MADLGDLVRDEVAGFEGVVLAKLVALYEATQCRVHPRKLTEAGELRGNVWIEEDRLYVIEEHAVVGFRHVAGRIVAHSLEAK